MKIIIQLVYILLSLVSALLGFAIVYWISGWIGYQWTLWGCAVIVFFVFVIGIGETIIDGLVPTAVITILNYIAMKVKPELLPIIAGVLVGLFIGGIVLARFEANEDDRKQAKKQQEWQEYCRYIETLPVAKPKADICRCLQAFRSYLNQVWSRLPSELFERHDNYYQPIHTWLQRQFVRIMEKRLGCPLQIRYGEYDQDYDDHWPEKKSTEPKSLQYRPMEIWVNGKYEFHSLVSVDDDGHYTEPPFDHVLIFDTGNPERVPRRRYIPFDQARFELRPVSWITKP